VPLPVLALAPSASLVNTAADPPNLLLCGCASSCNQESTAEICDTRFIIAVTPAQILANRAYNSDPAAVSSAPRHNYQIGSYGQVNDMAGDPQKRAPQLGATFYPGGQDDFYMYVSHSMRIMLGRIQLTSYHLGPKSYHLYPKGM
jgi:hypothetical protein